MYIEHFIKNVCSFVSFSNPHHVDRCVLSPLMVGERVKRDGEGKRWRGREGDGEE